MPRTKKEPANFFCPECNGEEVFVREETLWDINNHQVFCFSVKLHDCDARAQCHYCNWSGFKRDLIDKTEEIEAAEKLKADKEYQRYLKLKDKYEKK